jgi:hypothetical protein
LAPLTVEMLTQWACLTEPELVQCRNDAASGAFTSNVHTLHEDWPMNKFRNHFVCGKPGKLRTKMDMKTGHNRPFNHKASLWNWRRPFIKCPCQRPKDNCDGEFLWLDHAIWYVINHLDDFFPNPSLRARFYGFMVFLGKQIRKAVLALVTFLYVRKMMLKAGLQLCENPRATLLPEYDGAEGALTIERMMKPASFTEALDPAQSGDQHLKRPYQEISNPSSSLDSNPAPRGRPSAGRGFSGSNSGTPPQSYQHQQRDNYANQQRDNVPNQPRGVQGPGQNGYSNNRYNNNRRFDYSKANRRNIGFED